MRNKKNRRSPVSAICSALGTILLIVIILMCVPITVPKAFGFEVYTVISGSMEPAIPTGSMVFIKGMEPKEVVTDDVIAFYGGADSSAIITHRVVDNRVVMGEFITKGDANEAEDMNPVNYNEFIGRVEFSVPKLGMIAQLITTGTGKIAAACMIGFALVLHLIAGILDKR